MIHDHMSMGQAGIVSIASMLVVFLVLLVLYVIVLASGKIATRGQANKPAAPAIGIAPASAPAQDDSELIAVLSAAVAEYESTQSNPFIRNQQELN